MKEEMRRVLVFLQWKAAWWRLREAIPISTCPMHVEGVKAYALDQERVFLGLGTHFKTMWNANGCGEVSDDQGQDEEDEEEEAVADCTQQTAYEGETEDDEDDVGPQQWDIDTVNP